MLSAIWLAALAACLAFEAIRARRRMARIRRLLVAYESSARVFDPRPFDAGVIVGDIRRLMTRHALGDALFPGKSFADLESDLRLSESATEANTAVRAKMRLLLYRIYGCEERDARRLLQIDAVARRFCEGPAYVLRLLLSLDRLPGEPLLVGAAWVAALYALLLRYAI